VTSYLSVPEAAAQVRVSPWTIRWWLTSGRLTRFKAGGRTLIAASDLEAFVRREGSGVERELVRDLPVLFRARQIAIPRRDD
jgi:excisionase family DNA binding protein